MRNIAKFKKNELTETPQTTVPETPKVSVDVAEKEECKTDAKTEIDYEKLKTEITSEASKELNKIRNDLLGLDAYVEKNFVNKKDFSLVQLGFYKTINLFCKYIIGEDACVPITEVINYMEFIGENKPPGDSSEHYG